MKRFRMSNLACSLQWMMPDEKHRPEGRRWQRNREGTVNQSHVTTDRGARLARATVVLLRHAIACDQNHNWQMARVSWQKQADAYRELQAHNERAFGIRKNTTERFF